MNIGRSSLQLGTDLERAQDTLLKHLATHFSFKHLASLILASYYGLVMIPTNHLATCVHWWRLGWWSINLRGAVMSELKSQGL